jgi:hypothetical protein
VKNFNCEGLLNQQEKLIKSESPTLKKSGKITAKKYRPVIAAQ